MCSGARNRVPRAPISGGNSPSELHVNKGHGAPQRRARSNVEEWGNKRSATKRVPDGVSLYNVRDPQKRRENQTTFQPQETESIYQSAPLKRWKVCTVRDLIRPRDWLTKIDPKDAYYSIPIATNHQRFLRFSLASRTFQFSCLPFGLSSTPWAFTKALRAVTARLREPGIRLVIYLDDILILSNAPTEAETHTIIVMTVLSWLGFQVKEKKSVVMPTQRVEFLCFICKVMSSQ